MIVTINEDYQVKVDNYANYTLLKAIRDESGAIKTSKDKSIEQKTIGYYPNMRQALTACIHLMLEDKYDVMELTQYLDELKNLEAKFRPVMKRFREGDQMTKEEYVKTLKKYMADNELEQEDGLTYLDGIQDATTLARQLDEPKKVVIPQFMADWIEEAKEYYGSELDPLRIVYWTGDYISDNDSHYQWLENIYNQKLLLNAITNGYEVENEIEKYVRLKGFAGTTGYLNYDVNFKEFFVDTTGLDSCTKIKFTKSWLKDNWPEYEAYNNAGLLDFEEVEDE